MPRPSRQVVTAEEREAEIAERMASGLPAEIAAEIVDQMFMVAAGVQQDDAEVEAWLAAQDQKLEEEAKAKAAAPLPKRQMARLTATEQAWLKEIRRQEGATLALMQTLIEPLVTAMPVNRFTAYMYFRALALNPQRPGRFYMSAKGLAKKLQVSQRTAERIRHDLQQSGVLRLVQRGAGAYGAANVYEIVPLTPEVLAGMRQYFAEQGDTVGPEELES
jgi:hypothetical protein